MLLRRTEPFSCKTYPMTHCRILFRSLHLPARPMCWVAGKSSSITGGKDQARRAEIRVRWRRYWHAPATRLSIATAEIGVLTG